ncbi:hypothetical protein PC128_g21226 [Phytophthora cactorum]|nr:hypothetical protein PC128_g21226 [Phytophthora cactorum]
MYTELENQDSKQPMKASYQPMSQRPYYSETDTIVEMKYFDIAMISMMVYRKERESVCGLSRSESLCVDCQGA